MKFADIMNALVDKQANKAQKYEARKNLIVADTGQPIGGKWEGSYAKGLEILNSSFHERYRTLPRSLSELEGHFGPIHWKTMIIKSVDLHNFKGYAGTRSDVTVDGVTTKGKQIQYRYMQGMSTYSGMRYFRYDNGPLRLVNGIGSNYGTRPRDRFIVPKED